MLIQFWKPKKMRAARVRDTFRKYLDSCREYSKTTEQRALTVSPDQELALLNCFRLQGLLRKRETIRFEFLLDIHSLDCSLTKSLDEIEQRLDKGWTEAEEGVLKEINSHYGGVSREITEIRSKGIPNSLTDPLRALQQDSKYRAASIAHAAVVRKFQKKIAK
jgi:hypothetical protein